MDRNTTHKHTQKKKEGGIIDKKKKNNLCAHQKTHTV